MNTRHMDLLALGHRDDPEPALIAISQVDPDLGLRVDARSRRLVDAVTGEPLTARIEDWGAVAAIIAEAREEIQGRRAMLFGEDGERARRVVPGGLAPAHRRRASAYIRQELIRWLS